MNLSKMIDLIAEVALKRTTEKEEQKQETPDAVRTILLETHGVPIHLIQFYRVFRVANTRPC